MLRGQQQQCSERRGLCVTPGVPQEPPPFLPRGGEAVPVPGQHVHRRRHRLQGTQWAARVQGTRYGVTDCVRGRGERERERERRMHGAPPADVPVVQHKSVPALKPGMSLPLRPLLHPTRQEVGAQSSEVQARRDGCRGNRSVSICASLYCKYCSESNTTSMTHKAVILFSLDYMMALYLI